MKQQAVQRGIQSGRSVTKMFAIARKLAVKSTRIREREQHFAITCRHANINSLEISSFSIASRPGRQPAHRLNQTDVAPSGVYATARSEMPTGTFSVTRPHPLMMAPKS